MEILAIALFVLSIVIVAYVAYQMYRDCKMPLSHEQKFFDDYKSLDEDSKVMVERFADSLRDFDE